MHDGANPAELPVTLVLVSDYEPGGKTWEDEIEAVDAFFGDPGGAPAEIVVMEDEADPTEPPEALTRHGNRLRVGRAPAAGSAALKDAGVSLASHDLIAVVEADCLPRPGWMAAAVARMQADDRPDIVSGRTVYPGDTPLQRVMGLMDRGFAEFPMGGGRWHVSNNAAIYRREVLERFGYPQSRAEDLNPFVSAERRQDAMHAAGVRAAFAEDAACEHAYGGWPFIVDVRRNKGFQSAERVERRRKAAGRPVAGRWGAALRAAYHGLREDLTVARKVGPKRLKPLDWPLLAAMILIVRIYEVQGGLEAGDPEKFLETTAYR